MKRTFLSLVSLFIITCFCSDIHIVNNHVFAALECPSGYTCQDGCYNVGQCGEGNKTCELTEISSTVKIISAIGDDCGSAILGRVDPPTGVRTYNLITKIGVFKFISAGLRLFFIISGLLIFGNFLYSGYIYIVQAGDTKAHGEVKDRLTYSVIGLVVMVSAFILAGLVGAIVFGDPGFILKPEITQYGATSR